MNPTDKQVKFFYDNAGYSYNLSVETEEQGHQRTARELAEAELWAASEGVTYQWEEDETLTSPLINGRPVTRITYPEYICIARHPDNKVETSCGIDLGYLVSPYGSAYARVVQAELALELRAQMES